MDIQAEDVWNRQLSCVSLITYVYKPMEQKGEGFGGFAYI